LVHSRAQRIRAREMQFLAEAGMLASSHAEEVLRSRDRALEPFTNLVDAELEVMAARQLQKDCVVRSTAHSRPGATPADCETQTGEGEQSSSPVFPDELLTQKDEH
jgi:hypothetical protein